MMKRTFTAALAVAALISTTGCANMTPEEQNAAAAAVIGGLAGLAIGLAAQPRPVYVAPAPVYIAPPVHTTCRRWGNTVNCNSW